MFHGMIVIYIIYVVLMSILSVVFISLGRYISQGKGDNLIAGFNSAMKNDPDKYDVNRLRRATSLVLYFVAVILLLFCVVAFLPDNFSMSLTILLTVIIIILPFLGVIFMDRWARRK